MEPSDPGKANASPTSERAYLRKLVQNRYSLLSLSDEQAEAILRYENDVEGY